MASPRHTEHSAYREDIASQVRSVGNGVVIFDQFSVTPIDAPLIPGATGAAGNLILPGHIRGGQGIVEETVNGPKTKKQDTSVIYGRVKACGLDAHRGTYQPFPMDLQTWYPLPVGTFFTARKVAIWTNQDDEQIIDSCYLIEFWFPCAHRNKTTGQLQEASRPVWAPEE